jgi:hypothetical protein
MRFSSENSPFHMLWCAIGHEGSSENGVTFSATHCIGVFLLSITMVYSQWAATKVPIGGGVSLAYNRKFVGYRQSILKPEMKPTCIQQQRPLFSQVHTHLFDRFSSNLNRSFRNPRKKT